MKEDESSSSSSLSLSSSWRNDDDDRTILAEIQPQRKKQSPQFSRRSKRLFLREVWWLLPIFFWLEIIRYNHDFRFLTEALSSLPFGTRRSRLQVSLFLSSTSTINDDDKQQTIERSRSMGGVYNNELIQRLKDSVDIVDVVESYHLPSFKRSGNRATAVCPFHDDQNPSLSVDSARKMYKCFACGVGGDVFHFVREYSKLPGSSHGAGEEGTEWSFRQAVSFVSTEFGDGSLAIDAGRLSSIDTPANRIRQQKEERRIMANAAAAAYYEQCLLQPWAGAARTHLLSRSLPPAAILTFRIGYAPDAYFTIHAKRQQNLVSLVDHLKSLNFTALEIVDAGLATVSKQSRVQKATQHISDFGNSTNSTIKTALVNNNKTNEILEYSSLMDRFRGRLMIPIYDASGKIVLGFGGREIALPNYETAKITPAFKAPKYLNSPESALFAKKNILFGHNLAQSAVRENISQGTISRPFLVVVEGYMDAIALWGVGIRSVVASMGTALTSEQLHTAAMIVGRVNGRIVLCLDNDNAGRTAMKRLCTNGALSALTQKHVVEVAVAMLPTEYKDPAEFIEARIAAGLKLTLIGTEFQSQVIDAAKDWTDWYIREIINEYGPDVISGGTGSFSDIFDRIAKFLASSFGVADRTKRAFEVAQVLSTVMAKQQNATEVSSALRIQLESDLIMKAARLSDSKESLRRRAESVSEVTPQDAISVMSALTKGIGPEVVDKDGKLSKKARTSLQKKPTLPKTKASQKSVAPSDDTRAPARKPYRARLTRKKEVESLTPYFAGFQFLHETDSYWLGLNTKENRRRKNSGLLLGHFPGGKAQFLPDANAPIDSLVYFNSADFNGHQFLTDDAVNAGYENGQVLPRPSHIVETGISSLFEVDFAAMLRSVEDSLLSLMVKETSARTMVKNMLEARRAVNAKNEIIWSGSERQWLFSQLIGSTEKLKLPFGLNATSNLRLYLASRPDAPEGAFSSYGIEEENFSEKLHIATVNGAENRSLSLRPNFDFDSWFDGSGDRFVDCETSKSSGTLTKPGSLDAFFEEHSIEDDCANQLNHLDLAVQEQLISLLWASQAMKAKMIRQELMELAEKAPEPMTVLSPGSPPRQTKDSGPWDVPEEANGANLNPNENFYNSGEISGLDDEKFKLLGLYRETTRSLHSLTELSKRVSSQLLEESSMDGKEGRISTCIQAELASQIDDHLSTLLSKDYQPAPDDYRSESCEEALDRMAREWGDWFDDDYVWKPQDHIHMHLDGHVAQLSNLDNVHETKEAVDMELVELEWVSRED
jgi:DNA primase catalytic core